MKKLSEQIEEYLEKNGINQIEEYLEENGIGQKEIYYKPTDSTNKYFTLVMIDREKENLKTSKEIAKDLVGILTNQK